LVLQEDFRRAGPRLLLGREEPSRADILLAEQLRYFYMGESRLGPDVDREVVELMTDNMYQAGGRRLLDLLRGREEYAGGGSRLYQYLFSYVGSVTNTKRWFNLTRPELGACHGDELDYLFQPEGNSPLVTEENMAVSRFMVAAWTNFAKTGNPNPEGGNLWPRLTPTEGRYLQIDATVFAPNLPPGYVRKTRFWEEVLTPRLTMEL
jgi:carboxylesterase type B